MTGHPVGSYGQAGQIFSKESTAIFYNWWVPASTARITPPSLVDRAPITTHTLVPASPPPPPLPTPPAAPTRPAHVPLLLHPAHRSFSNPSNPTGNNSRCSACWTLTSSAVRHQHRSTSNDTNHTSSPPLPRFPAGRTTPSVSAIVQPGAPPGSFQKLFFGREEVAIPQYRSTADAVAAHPRADIFINFSSYRSAFESSMDALTQPTIRVVAIIAEGVPERDARTLIAYAEANGTTRNSFFFFFSFV
jgi:hypothetical protein